MANTIHPTAIVHPNVKLGDGNVIGPYCTIEANVQIGSNNIFHANVNIGPCVTIGDSNMIYSSASIGYPGEMGNKGDRMAVDGKTIIGNGNIIRENVCINAPVYFEATRIGNNCYLMNNSYVAHDVSIGDFANLTSGVKLGGRAVVGAYANIGMNATVHQRISIGESAMIGMNAVVNRHIVPFAVVAGNPCRLMKFNKIGAERRFNDGEKLSQLEADFNAFIENMDASDNLPTGTIKEFIDTVGKDGMLMKKYGAA